jgi:hypothetical protein
MDDNTLLSSLFEAYGTEQTKTALVNLLKDTLKFTSVFDITRLTEAEFQKQFDDAIKADNTLKDHATNLDTAKLYDDINCLATQISHLYREQRTSVETAQDQWHPLGIRAVEKQGPTYTHLFKENWDDACKNDSIAAIDSPVAYLRALYRFALQLETSVSSSPGEKNNRITLEKRRPDLAELSIDQQGTFTAQPMLGIINKTLDKNIQNALKDTEDSGKSTYDVLAKRYYPFALPYEFFHHQCLLGLSANKPTLGELNYLVSESLPLTPRDVSLYGKLVNTGADQAQLLMSGLGPKQQALLTERPWAEKILTNRAYASLQPTEQGERKKRYWKKIYGDTANSDLKHINIFLERTELKAEQMEVLLAQGKYAPCLSPHYLLPAPHSQPFGARYVNGPRSVDDSMVLNIEQKPGEITHATEDRLERLHRMIRLQRWLAIPFNQLDGLISSAFESQLSLNAQRLLDSYAIRALGVYRYMSRQYSITAEEFAALLHHVAPYAPGDDTSLFDKVFNQSRVFATALKIDGRAFVADDSDPASHTILQHLSTSLGLPLTEDSLMHVVKNTLKYQGSLNCDLPTLSSIYRQARIARVFGLSIAECSTLANLLGGEPVARCLTTGDAGKRTLRIRGKKGEEYFELVAIFQLSEQSHSGETRLFPGSTLRTNSSWFADPTTTKKLGVRFSQAPGINSARLIFINQIPTTPLSAVTSLEGLSIHWSGGTLDKLSLLQSPAATLQSTPLTGEIDSIGFHTGLSDQITLVNEAPQEDTAQNILDVLMQMDWITRWIKQSAYDIPMLQRALELQGLDDYPLGGLQQHLIKLGAETRQCVITAQELATLALPGNVDWRAKLANTLLDDKGLVNNFAPSIQDDVVQKLTLALNNFIEDETFKLDDDPEKDLKLKKDARQKLKKLLLLAHDRQLHLIEAFLQETLLLPMNCAKDVVIWANTSIHQILTQVINSKDPHALVQTLHPLLRHTETAVRLQLSNKALRALLSNAHWLDTPEGELRLSFKSLYLFDRFNHCLKTYTQTEESLLSYLEFANSVGRESDALNGRLAQLLNWETAEVTMLTSKLMFRHAKSVKDIDWIMRCHQACKATGLSATALLSAATLDNNSSLDQWKTVGEAVMAASH